MNAEQGRDSHILFSTQRVTNTATTRIKCSLKKVVRDLGAVTVKPKVVHCCSLSGLMRANTIDSSKVDGDTTRYCQVGPRDGWQNSGTADTPPASNCTFQNIGCVS